MKWVLLLVLLLIFASGCIDLPFNPFGKDVVDVKTSVINEGPSDIVIIKDAESIPHSPMLPEQRFLFSFIIENKDDLKTAEKVAVDLYDAPLIKDGSDDNDVRGTPCNVYDTSKRHCVPRELSCTSEKCEDGECTVNECVEICSVSKTCEILPGEEQAVNFDLLTPTQKEIVNIMTKTTLNYRVNYRTAGSLLYVVPVINKDEIIQRQRAGEKTTLTITKSQGSGPIKIDVELYGAPYILAGETATFLFRLKNTGQGTLEKDNAMQPRMLSIYFPKEMMGTSGITPPSSKWDCREVTDENHIVYVNCTNTQPLPLYKDESRASIRFEIKKVRTITEPFKSFEIHAEVNYNYELRGSYVISVNPFQNV
jgi:hypothetical protein